jgi:hypothetical protein
MLKERVNAKMSEFIIKSCFHLVNSIYADGHEAVHECGNSLLDEKCKDVKDCPYKKIAEKLLKVVNAGTCNYCDGCGYDEGCADEECGVHAAHECLDLLNLEFKESEK